MGVMNILPGSVSFSVSVLCVGLRTPLEGSLFPGLLFAGCETFGGSHNLSALPLFNCCEKSTQTQWRLDLKHLTQCVPCSKHQIIDIFPGRGPKKFNH